MLQNILNLYKSKFPFDKFYDNLFYNIDKWPEYHISNKTFLAGYPFAKQKIKFKEQKIALLNNIRVDLPVWFGHPDAKEKFVVVGMEPRNTDTVRGHLNIEHKDNYVFATPFAIERPRGPYHRAFTPITENPDVFSYFTDVVKEYPIISEDKKLNDHNARKMFWENAERTLPFLMEELHIIKPSRIIALGNDSLRFLQKHFAADFQIERCRHPSYGGTVICRTQLENIVNNPASNVHQ